MALIHLWLDSLKKERLFKEQLKYEAAATEVGPTRMEGVLQQDSEGFYAIGRDEDDDEIMMRLPLEGITQLIAAALIPKTDVTPQGTEDSGLEMACTGSKTRNCPRPSHVFMIHDAPAGTTDLEGYHYGMASRVTLGTNTYMLTAYHCLEALSKAENPLIRVNQKDYPFDKTWLIHGRSPTSELDLALVKVPITVWAGLGIQSCKISRTLSSRDLLKVYSLDRYGNYSMATTLPGKVVGPYRGSHSASTGKGSSGGPIMRGNVVAMLHTGANRSQGCNNATITTFLANMSIETPVPNQFYDEEEFDDEKSYENWEESNFYTKDEHRRFLQEGKTFIEVENDPNSRYYSMLHGGEITVNASSSLHCGYMWSECPSDSEAEDQKEVAGSGGSRNEQKKKKKKKKRKSSNSTTEMACPSVFRSRTFTSNCPSSSKSGDTPGQALCSLIRRTINSKTSVTQPPDSEKTTLERKDSAQRWPRRN